ncbi:hypothetical protein HELRODRAFT_165541 [Helobdella robusta]|uniref:Uncharacterized protein n=1 Tax=Helobdella robusta TaxID=6412 RepID=T1EWZ7_HELRO|nr:hypothetical protein HELRODRAFT_165541 [Helobdella robusta]ESN91499.1 hypothetical protein HELRODRAFT_165541 [Helobdella robusta]
MINALKLEIQKYGENTSIRGLSKLFKSNDKFLKLLWLILLLGSSTYMTMRLDKLFSDYYSYPVTTEYGENIGQNILFPDITLCNIDPFATSQSKEFSLDNYLAALNSIQDRFYEYIKKTGLIYIFDANSAAYINNTFNEMNSVTGYIINLNKEMLKSNDCPNFIVDCSFFATNWFKTKETCSIFNFTKRWNVNYHTCYTLKSGDLNFSHSNIIRGLDVLLNVGPPNFIQIPFKSALTSSQARGVQVSVHSPGTPPDLKRGFNVAPGTENIVEIVQTERNRLKTPYNKLGCTRKSHFYNSSDKYTHDLCTEYCQQEYTKNVFGCITHQLTVPENEFDNIPFCGNFCYYFDMNINVSAIELIKNTVLKLTNSLIVNKDFRGMGSNATKTVNCVNNCLMPCHEMSYQSFLTSASWPQSSVQLDLFEKFFINRGCMYNPRVRARYVNYYEQILANKRDRTSLLNLTVMPESLLKIKFVMKQNFPYFQTDKPVYTDDMMIGAVGGMLSLWLGITVASGVEVIELVYLLFKRCWEHKKLNTYKFYMNTVVDNKTGSLN